METTKKNFTAGPWKTVPPQHGNETEYLCVQIGEDESYTTLELRPEDARLIATAPEMFAALKSLLNDIEGDPLAAAYFDLRHIDAARAALAKAVRP